MSKRRRFGARSDRDKSGRAFFNIAVLIAFLAGAGALYYNADASNPDVDERTLCPDQPASTTILLVDVTDPMNLPQRQDFHNKFNQLRTSIPRFGKLIVVRVDPVSTKLLRPIITLCNPGTSDDVSEWTSDKQGVQRTWEEKFAKPLERTFEELLAASAATSSPILESIQSVALTDLQAPTANNHPRHLVVVSDLLQHTPSISFYNSIPNADQLVASEAFSRVRTDLKGIDVELWMLERGDFSQTQPRALPDLWERMIAVQGGRWKSLRRVSG